MHLGVETASMAGDLRGIGRYTRRLLSHFARLRPDLRVTLYTDSARKARALAAELPGLGYGPERGAVARVDSLRDDPPDLLWYPWSRITHRTAGLRTVVTIHDLAPFYLESRSWLRRLDRWRRRRRLHDTARRADLILTDSQYSRDDILARLGVPPDRVIAIPLAADDFVPAQGALDRGWLARRFGLVGDYLLFVGARDRRKNLPRLRDAFQALRGGAGPAAQLAICGHPGPPGASEPGVSWLGRVTDEELRALYQGACVFVLPSLLEGFGLPVLEAMASGTPVICSNTTSLPEVAGDAALYFDPLDVEEMARQMMRCLGDEALRTDLVTRGFEQARKFRWEYTARRTLTAFDAVLASASKDR
ncbi:MAG: glycosyltransferase family 4 protein [Gemmatimonadales bacterium]